MLTAKKKIAVREVAPKSRVVVYWGKLREFYGQYQQFIFYGLGAIVILAIFGYIYISNRKTNEEEASRQLRVVQPLVQQNQFKLAIGGDQTRKIPGLKDIVDKYGSTPSGELAAVLLGNCYLYTDQFDKALETFDNTGPSDNLLKSAALAGEAAAYEGKKDFASAARYYEKAAGAFDNDFLTATRYFNAGRMYCLSNNKEKAQDMFAKVKEAKTPRFDNDIQRLTAQYGLQLD